MMFPARMTGEHDQVQGDATGRARPGVSEVIGTLTLIGVIVLGLVIVNMVVISQPRAARIPAIEATITNQGALISMTHQGGDTLSPGEYRILVDGNDTTANFTNSKGETTWSVGDTLFYDAAALYPGNQYPRRVVVVYNGSGMGTGGVQILSTKFPWGVSVAPYVNLSTPVPQPSVQPPAPPPAPPSPPVPPWGLPWYNCNWQYRKNITIWNNSVVGAPVKDFPVYINITNDNDLKTQTNPSGNGYDILFTDSTGTKALPYERENFCRTAGDFTGWVQVQGLSRTQPNVTIYMYFGNPGTPFDNADPEDTWNASFKGVWHMNTTLDSTSNNNDATNNGATSVSGLIGQSSLFGQAFDFESDESDYFRIADASSLDITQAVTISAWMKLESYGIGSEGSLLDKDFSSGYSFYPSNVGSNNRLRFGFGGSEYNSNTGILTTGTRYYAVVTYNRSYVVFYTNGVYRGRASATAAIPTNSYDVLIGSGWSSGSIYYDFDGTLDEVHLSNIAYSSQWIQTEYNNQNTPWTFAVVNRTSDSWASCY